jgi:hypothetical protein
MARKKAESNPTSVPVADGPVINEVDGEMIYHAPEEEGEQDGEN